MDFFEHQQDAKRKSGRLVLLFVLATLLIIATVYLVASAVIVNSTSSPQAPGWFDPLRLLVVGVGVGGLIAAGSAWKISQLSGGGAAIAESMRGRLVEPGSADPLERRLLNVVEEMAIASGLPVPPVYLMDEEHGINAFAAGTDPADCVLGFTRGALEKLSRAELQGVVGHEFSHVLNGDMRLNLRLIGVLHGILVIGLVGQYVFDTVRWAPTRSRDNTSSATVIALAIGLTLVVLGLVGTFFGKLIKAAVSRQREFLADASAVQFTRDPGGIAGALKKIGGYATGSQIRDPHAAEVSHMLFEEHGRRSLSGLTATHPPLDERIRRIQPSFAGELEALSEPTDDELEALRAAVAAEEQEHLAAVAGLAPATGSRRAGRVDRAALERKVGEVDADQAPRVRRLLDRLPRAILRGAGEPFDARAIVCGLVLSSDAEVCEQQLAGLSTAPDPQLAERIRALSPEVVGLAPHTRLPVLDLCLRSLRSLTPGQYRNFTAVLDQLIHADRRVDLFEACIRRIVHEHLDRQLAPEPRPREPELRLEGAASRVAIVIGMLVQVGHTEHAAAEAAFRSALEPLGVHAALPDPRTVGEHFESALAALARLRPADKREFLAAAGRAVEHDGRLEVAEVELLRAIAETVGVPVPPALAVADGGAESDPVLPAGPAPVAS